LHPHSCVMEMSYSNNVLYKLKITYLTSLMYKLLQLYKMQKSRNVFRYTNEILFARFDK